MEQLILNQILRAFGTRPTMRLWRQNTGVAVPYSTCQAALTRLRIGDASGAAMILQNARPITFGLPGQADLTGIYRGLRLEIEVKDKTKQSDKQRHFAEMILKQGGVYILAHSVTEVEEGLKWLKE